MSTYVVDAGINSGHLTQSEIHLYGSSRLGIINTATNVEEPVNSDGLTNFERGRKFFELSNHLGNVMVTVSDKNLQVEGGVPGIVGYYTADVVTANDYYPGGMLMPGRSYTNGSGYRYGFNGKENDNEVKGEGNQQDYGMRIYDPRLGRFLSVDLIADEYPELTPYQFASNSPIKFIDRDGLERSNPQAKQPTGVTFLSKAILPPGGMIDLSYSIKAGNYKLYPVRAKEAGKEWWLARKEVSGGYQDDWIVGTDAVALFQMHKNEYNWMAGWVNQAEGSGGGLLGAYKSTWTPQNVAAGLTMGLYGIASMPVRVNLMGGTRNNIKGTINYDLQALDGIKADVSSFKEYFPKKTVAEVFVENSQAAFLNEITPSVQTGGTVTIRGQMANKNFSDIFNTEAIKGFEIISRKTGLPKAGYKMSNGQSLRGAENSITEIILKKLK